MAKQIVFDPAKWGGCPRCHHNDGCLYAPISGGMRQWFWCRRHKIKWRAENKFPFGRQLMPRWKLQCQARLLAACHEVNPWYLQSENEFREKMYFKNSRTD